MFAAASAVVIVVFILSDDLVLFSLGGCLAWETLKRTSPNRARTF